MRKNKRWIAVTALAGVTAAALITAVVVKNNLKPGSGNGSTETIAITQAATDLGVKQVVAIKGENGEITGYKVNVEAKGFGTSPIELAVSFNATVDTITGVEVVSHSETEGYGANMTQPEFLNQFKNVKLPVYIEGMSVSAEDVLQVLSLASFEASATTFVDGTYEVVGEPDAKGFTSKVTLTVQGGKITGVEWDNMNADGKWKSVMSQNGEYVMTETGLTWYEQAQLLAQNVIDNQGVSALAMNEQGKTDSVAGVSITVSKFVEQVQEGMIMATGKVANTANLTDGVFEVVGEPDAKGYTSKTVVTIEGGKITAVVWDSIDQEGKAKSVMSQNGEYVMTETGLSWYEQAQLLAQNVITNQGVSALAMNETGKIDSIAGVSITISSFVDQVEEALTRSANANKAVVLKDGVFEIVGEPDAKGYTSKTVVTVKGGKITEVVWDCIDQEGKAKSIMSQNGEYVMSETGLTWYEQAQLLAQNVIANQGVSSLIMNEAGKIDSIAGVSISINSFVSQVEEALLISSGAKEQVVATLKDGIYEIVGEPDAKGYTSKTVVTIEGGKITAVVWDSIDKDGKLKSVMSQNGEYVMTETGLTWFEQAQLLAQNVINNQGVSALKMDEQGKIDSIAGVSISINSFVSQVEEALLQASGAKPVEKPEDETPTNVEGTKVDGISGATVTSKAFITAINNAYEYLINNLVK